MVNAIYDLHKLGWHSFQQLCLTITREILGQTVEIFLDTHDGGRDGAFSGNWQGITSEDLSGRFVIQCKFTVKQDGKLTLSSLDEEFQKVEQLIAKGICDCYVLMTNAGVSAVQSEKIASKLQKLGVKASRIFGQSWICRQIHENNRLRMMVPRVYGLGDLSQILDERAYSQAKHLLASLRDDLAKVVITDSYTKAAAALDDHGFVLLIGEPAAGKTTIASLLAMAALDQWNAHTLKLDTPEQVVERWNPDFPSQFFWIDDCFGVTQYENNLVNGWNHKFAQVKSMLNQGIKIVMTSRDYIYRRARNDLKIGAFPLLEENKVVIDVHTLSISEKQQILYNHLKLGSQPKKFITSIKTYLPSIAEHKRFIPETARRLSEPAFTKNLYLGEFHIEQFVTKQESFLKEVLEGLDIHSRAALAIVYMNSGHLKSPVELQESELSSLDRLGSNIANCIQALESMNNSLVQYVTTEDDAFWRFKHPTIGDAFASNLIKSPELFGIYLQGAPIEMLIDQITCGNVKLENAVVVPSSFYPGVIQRLSNFKNSEMYKTAVYSEWKAKRVLLNFLATRCSKEFLKLYIKQNPAIIDEVSHPSLYLSYSEEVNLAITLNQLQLLPEEFRITFINKVMNYALQGEDLFGLENEKIRSVFTEDEFSRFKERIHDELLPNLPTVRENWESNFRGSEDNADEYMERLNDILYTLSNFYSDEESILETIEIESSNVKAWIAENMRPENSERAERVLGEFETSENPLSKRSIFDDIDE